MKTTYPARQIAEAIKLMLVAGRMTPEERKVNEALVAVLERRETPEQAALIRARMRQ